MKKEQVKVIINNEQEAEQAKSILKALGQSISVDFYYKNTPNINQSHLFFSKDDGIWLCFKCDQSEPLCVITLKELIIILSKEEDIKKPVFAIKSVDGVDLFFGDTVHRAYFNRFCYEWMYDNCVLNNNMNAVLTGVDKAKAFSNKKSALKWIDEQNKPKEIILDYPTITITIDKYGFSAKSKLDTRKFTFDSEDIEKISEAHKSLQ